MSTVAMIPSPRMMSKGTLFVVCVFAICGCIKVQKHTSEMKWWSAEIHVIKFKLSVNLVLLFWAFAFVFIFVGLIVSVSIGRINDAHLADYAIQWNKEYVINFGYFRKLVDLMQLFLFSFLLSIDVSKPIQFVLE